MASSPNNPPYHPHRSIKEAVDGNTSKMQDQLQDQLRQHEVQTEETLLKLNTAVDAKEAERQSTADTVAELAKSNATCASLEKDIEDLKHDLKVSVQPCEVQTAIFTCTTVYRRFQKNRSNGCETKHK
jgi:hypothetical protein